MCSILHIVQTDPAADVLESIHSTLYRLKIVLKNHNLHKTISVETKVSHLCTFSPLTMVHTLVPRHLFTQVVKKSSEFCSGKRKKKLKLDGKFQVPRGGHIRLLLKSPRINFLFPRIEIHIWTYCSLSLPCLGSKKSPNFHSFSALAGK